MYTIRVNQSATHVELRIFQDLKLAPWAGSLSAVASLDVESFNVHYFVRVDLPFGPLQSVTSVVTYDRANDASTFSSDNYQVDLQGGRVYLNEGETWPAELRATNAVEITYIAGYGSGNIPAPIVQAIKMYVSTLYDGTCEGVTEQMSRLVSPYRRHDGLPF